jgi:outer membrane protein OmpA-like peptidoglycan-associated protein
MLGMNGQIAGDHGGKAGRKSLPLAALALALVLAGCAQTPDWVNPVNWVDGMLDRTPDWVNPVNWVDGMLDKDVNQVPPGLKTTAEIPGSEKPFPKLGDTQAPVKTGTTAVAWQNLANSLIADRDNAKYTDQNLRAGDQRPTAAPPPPERTKVAMAKPAVPEGAKRYSNDQLAEVRAIKGAAALPASPSLPRVPALMPGRAGANAGAARSNGLSQVPSIVQRRRGSPRPPPTPVVEVSRQPITPITRKSDDATSDQKMAGTATLPLSPTAIAPATAPPPMAVPRMVPKLIPPPARAVTQVAAQAETLSPSVQVNLLLSQDQSVLAQIYAAALADQGSPVLRRPGNVFDAPNATPIGGQWPTVVPGVVKDAFNAPLGAAAPAPIVLATAVQAPLAPASLQIGEQAAPRLPGAPGLIRFRHGSASLSGKGKKYLNQVANRAKREGKTVFVVGHSSKRTGDMSYAKHKMVNFNLSFDRANIVARELRRRGVVSEQIVVQAKGDAEPLYFEFMPYGEAKNRRVEVYVR